MVLKLYNRYDVISNNNFSTLKHEERSNPPLNHDFLKLPRSSGTVFTHMSPDVTDALHQKKERPEWPTRARPSFDCERLELGAENHIETWSASSL